MTRLRSKIGWTDQRQRFPERVPVAEGFQRLHSPKNVMQRQHAWPPPPGNEQPQE